jgi:hypothetical protein
MELVHGSAEVPLVEEGATLRSTSFHWGQFPWHWLGRGCRLLPFVDPGVVIL